MKRIVAVAGQRKVLTTTSAKLVKALASSFDKHYEQSRDISDFPDDANLYIQYGFKRTRGLDAAMQRQIPFVILDRGYFADRNMRFSVSINGFHGLSMDVTAIKSRKSREYPALKEPRSEGDYVYIYGQLQNDRACRGLIVDPWMRREAQKASEALGLPCKLRPHPLTISPWEKQLPPLEKSFEDAYAGVFWTSTATVQAVIAGINCLALHPANPVYDACAHTYDQLADPDEPRARPREEVLHDLSWRNYRRDEIRQASDYVRLAYQQAATEALANFYDTQGLRV